jgi:hypothetical protein
MTAIPFVSLMSRVIIFPIVVSLFFHGCLVNSFQLSLPTVPDRCGIHHNSGYGKMIPSSLRCPTQTRRATLDKSPFLMQISLFGSDESKTSSTRTATSVSLPRDVKEAVSKCRQATQDALKDRLSRMDIEFPVGTKFGVEKIPSQKGRKSSAATAGVNDGGPTKAILDQSDRELARLFVEMFQPVGGDNIVVAFVDESLADAARQNWKNDYGATSRVMAMNRRRGVKSDKSKKDTKKSKGLGFAAKLAAEVADVEVGQPTGGSFDLPQGTEVALFVAPGPKELVVIEKICNRVGMGTLVILLNARLSKITNFGTDPATKLFTEEFSPVFSLTAAPQNEAPGCLMYRAFPGDWVLARKPKIGQPKTILAQSTKPTNEECKLAFDELEIGDLEKNVEGFVENIAGWFR